MTKPCFSFNLILLVPFSLQVSIRGCSSLKKFLSQLNVGNMVNSYLEVQTRALKWYHLLPCLELDIMGTESGLHWVVKEPNKKIKIGYHTQISSESSSTFLLSRPLQPLTVLKGALTKNAITVLVEYAELYIHVAILTRRHHRGIQLVIFVQHL